MDIELAELESRLKRAVKHAKELGKRIVFWEDESGDYAKAVGELAIPEFFVVDATGRELYAKRYALREHPQDQFVIYRSGERPIPVDDFLYDVKLAAVPFSCSVEGIWATEVGVNPEFASVLAEHSKFFNSKERKEKLAVSLLSKDSEAGILLAMLAVCVNSKAENTRDAVRDVAARLLIEYSREQNTAFRLISDSGLTATLWSSFRTIFGYEAPAGEVPTIGDFAYRALVAKSAPLAKTNECVLAADAIKVLTDISQARGTAKDYEALVQKLKEPIAELVPSGARTAETIKGADCLPEFDEWTLLDLMGRLETGALTSDEAVLAVGPRHHTFWYEHYYAHYTCIVAAAELQALRSSFEIELPIQGNLAALLKAYRDSWCRLDAAYRRFVCAYHKVPNGGFKRRLEALRDKLYTSYDAYLASLTECWQKHILDEGVYPPSTLFAQSSFFNEKVSKAFPEASRSKRIGIIISDALRYEVGRELSDRLAAEGARGGLKTTCEACLSMLPSYTQLGMAALLPAGEMSIDPATENVIKAGQPTDGTANRQKLLAAELADSIALQASTFFDQGLPDISNAPLVVIYQNVIDKRGDSRDTENEVFAACEEAMIQLQDITSALLKAGCSKVLITSDHGFIYQDRTVESFDYADVDGLAAARSLDGFSHGRRWAVGSVIPESDMLIKYDASQLSLVGEYKIALSRGITRMRQRGSGSRYVHGGASVQENVIPVITVEQLQRSSHGGPVGVQGFLLGRPSITGPTVSLDVYQTEPCGDDVTPSTVKVGLYSKDGKLLCASEKSLELESTLAGAEERKTRVTLHVTNDVDEYDQVILRISKRIAGTNQFTEAWKETLSVNRAFGNDFDF